MAKKKLKKKKKSRELFGYCFTCQEARLVKNGIVELLQNGKKILKGDCVVCGTHCARMMSRDVPHDRVQTPREAKTKRKDREKKQTKRILRLRKGYNMNRQG